MNQHFDGHWDCFFSIALAFRTICGKFSKCWQLFSSSTMKIKLEPHSNWTNQQLFESRTAATTPTIMATPHAVLSSIAASLRLPVHLIPSNPASPSYSLPLIATLPTSVFKVLLFLPAQLQLLFSSHRKWSGTSSYSCEYPLYGMNVCDTLVFNGFCTHACVIYLGIYIIGLIN